MEYYRFTSCRKNSFAATAGITAGVTFKTTDYLHQGK